MIGKAEVTIIADDNMLMHCNAGKSCKVLAPNNRSNTGKLTRNLRVLNIGCHTFSS
jgi:hypothetical protein